MRVDVESSTFPDSERVAEEVRAHLGRARMSQAALGRELGLNENYISRRLSGSAGLIIRGKGDKLRIVPVDAQIRAAILACPPGYIFPSRWDGPASHMHVDALGKGMRRALGWHSSAHPLRHRFATRAYRGTRDLRAVQTLLGHASPATTAVYVQVEDDALVAAVQAAA